MTRWMLITTAMFGVLLGGCVGNLQVGPQGDDDDVTDDDDMTDDDDDVTDDDDVADDDDDDTSTDDDDTVEPCCSDCEYPAYVFDTLVIAVMFPYSEYNDFLTDLLADSLPPTGQDVILLFDPEPAAVNGGPFEARFGLGEVTGDLYSMSSGGNPAVLDYAQQGNGVFTSLDQDLTLQLSFGVTIPLYHAVISGRFMQAYALLDDGAIAGELREQDTVDIKTSFGNLYELMQERPLDVDVDGDGQLDGWSFRMEFSAFQFL